MDEISSLEEDLVMKKYQLQSIQFNEWHEPPSGDKKASGTFGIALLR